MCAIRDREATCYGKDGDVWLLTVGILRKDRKGNLWVGATGGVWKWRPEPRAFLPIPDDKDPIYSFAEDAEGALLFTTATGIRRVVGNTTEPYPTPTSREPLKSICLQQDRDGGLWIGTTNGGLVHVAQEGPTGSVRLTACPARQWVASSRIVKGTSG